MLAASDPISLLDRYRVPYVVDGQSRDGLVTVQRADRAGARLLSLGAARDIQARSYILHGAVLHVGLAESAAVTAVLGATGLSWEEELPILDLHGVKQGSVYRGSDGSVFVPFDLDSPLDALTHETYLEAGGPGRVHALMRFAYYRVRPAIPRRMQLAMRRGFRRRQERATFPAWPTETSLHRLEAIFLGLIEGIAGEPLPWLAPWPAPFGWALVLTHDVEQSSGYEHIPVVRALEEQYSLRSAWYFVPERDYRVDESTLAELRGSGCEICLHGLRHDGRDLAPRTFASRLPAMRAYAERWGARGFRGPATRRDRELVQQLGVLHDSSWCDVARYEPEPGGCCSWHPFLIGDVVELPITLPMDHTLFEVLGQTTEAVWLEKAALLRAHGGMALMVTHPDYLVDRERLLTYDRFLAGRAVDATAWHALPCEVAEWWRDRSRTILERLDGGWVASGPGAHRCRVRLGAPDPPPPVSRTGGDAGSPLTLRAFTATSNGFDPDEPT